MPPDAVALRFAGFVLDCDTRTLSSGDTRLRLQEQSFLILQMLLERRGRVVTRDELRAALWPAGTFVDFEHSLNAAIKRLRAALGDEADNPRFIETIPRRGYRFLAGGDAVAHGANVSPRIRLAVLPFVEVEANADEDFLSRGFTEEMISELGRRAGASLGVISSHSSMAFSLTSLRAREIGSLLHADYLLEGCIARHDGQVRVTARLIEASSETQLWVDTCQRPFTDWLAAQTEIAGRIARSLAMELNSDNVPRNRTARTPAAYDAYLKGRYHWYRVADSGASEARRFFEESIALDSSFARAHGGLALIHSMRAWYYHLCPRQALEDAKESAASALRLDPLVAEAHVADGDVKRLLLWDARAARLAYDTAIRLNPSFATAHSAMARLLVSAGCFAPAIREAELGRELDLQCPTANTLAAWVSYLSGDYDAAIALCRHALEMDETHLRAKLVLGSALLETEGHKEALRVLEEAASAPEIDPLALTTLAYARAITGKMAAAIDAVAAAERIGRSRYVSPYYLAVALAGLGDVDAAFHTLDRACDDRDPAVLYIGVDPRLASLRGDARYAALIARLRPEDLG
jgi:TolB-like protein